MHAFLVFCLDFMAWVYKSEHHHMTVGICDINRCTDIACIDDTVRYLRDQMKCDLLILSNTTYGKIQDTTTIWKFLGSIAHAGKSVPTKRRCLPFIKSRTNDNYTFEDVLIRLSLTDVPEHNVWTELRVEPFGRGFPMDDNLGWAPGLLPSDGYYTKYGDWNVEELVSFGDIRTWAAENVVN